MLTNAEFTSIHACDSRRLRSGNVELIRDKCFLGIAVVFGPQPKSPSSSGLHSSPFAIEAIQSYLQSNR